MHWTPTSTGHEVALLDGKVVARGKTGRVLKSLPPAVRDDPATIGLRQLTEWLTRHEAACVTQAETWLVRSLPVPVPVLAALWPDPSWRRALVDLVALPPSEATTEAGLLRDVDPTRGVGVVTLDGDTVWWATDTVTFPHPVLLADLDDFRGFAADLGIEQVVPQLFRETWARPAGADLDATSVEDWSGGRFRQLSHLVGRATSQGYAVRGGYATVRIFENLRTVEARLWIGSDDPSGPGETGELQWVDDRARPLRLGEVGPVAWSEGTRMAARIHAGRVVDTEEEQA